MNKENVKMTLAEKGRHVIMYFSCPENYNDDVSLLCMSRSRKFGLGTAAELITTAHSCYDPEYPTELLDLQEEEKTCKKLLEAYKIGRKEMIMMYLDKPEYIKKPEQVETTPWKRIVFDDSVPDQLRTYEWICEFAPRERVAPTLRMIRQYLVLTGNKHYFEQRARRLMKALLALKNESNQEELKKLINIIWKIGVESEEKND